ncbi:hypothetical protein TNCV_1957171 [Trichonephila clavipes]|nr:hypothetical protein TNCV_1957171 [Trichonephila clavipes]
MTNGFSPGLTITLNSLPLKCVALDIALHVISFFIDETGYKERAIAAPFATTDSGQVRMDSSCVSPQPGQVPNCRVPCF